MITTCYAGCDISSRRLDLCCLAPDGAVLEADFANDADGAAGVVAALRHAGAVLVVLEASGGYETGLVQALWAAGLPVALVPAQRVRHFARAAGQLAKTDRIDARILAEFAVRMTPVPMLPEAENRRVLRALVARRRVLVETRAAERKRLRQAALARIVASIERSLRALSEEIAALEAEIRAQIAACREAVDRARRLMTMPGIGAATAATLMAELPELGGLKPGQAAALAGLAPHARRSGKWCGKSFISGGRKPPRDALFMAATVAVFHAKSRFEDTYKDLRKAGKPHKVALVAVMRKMIETLNAMLRDNADYKP